MIGVALLAEAQSVDVDRLPPGGRSILYIGVVIAWGFAAVGAYAHSRRPENHTGALMVLVGDDHRADRAAVLRRSRCCSRSACCWTRSASRRWCTCCSRSRPAAWKAAGLARALFAAYIAGCLQVPALFVSECPECPRGNPLLIEENDVIATIVGVPQGLLFLFALVTTVVILLRRRQAATPAAAARASSPSCCSAR